MRPNSKPGDPRFRSRLLIGAIAGIAGTLAMTAAMSRLHRRLPNADRYPLTPREIVDSVAVQTDVPLQDATALDLTTVGHFTYGAACGSLIAAINPRIGPLAGALAGTGVWAASYLGWIPAVGILEPATLHPRRRNALMIAVHMMWGAATALAMRELLLARETMMADGGDKDAPKGKAR
jgi:hypothetical protein